MIQLNTECTAAIRARLFINLGRSVFLPRASGRCRMTDGPVVGRVGQRVSGNLGRAHAVLASGVLANFIRPKKSGKALWRSRGTTPGRTWRLVSPSPVPARRAATGRPPKPSGAAPLGWARMPRLKVQPSRGADPWGQGDTGLSLGSTPSRAPVIHIHCG